MSQPLQAFRTYRLLLGVVFIVWPLLLLQITYTFPRFRPPPGSNAMANVFATTGTSWNAVDSSSTDTKAREALEEQPKFTADGLNDWLTGSIHAVEHTDGDDGEDGDAQAELDDPGPIRSQVLIHASSSGTGLLNKYFYRFQDVQLSSDGVTVFYDPDTFDPPYQPYWVDMVSGNGSLPYLPTRFVIKGDTHNIQWCVPFAKG